MLQLFWCGRLHTLKQRHTNAHTNTRETHASVESPRAAQLPCNGMHSGDAPVLSTMPVPWCGAAPIFARRRVSASRCDERGSTLSTAHLRSSVSTTGRVALVAITVSPAPRRRHHRRASVFTVATLEPPLGWLVPASAACNLRCVVCTSPHRAAIAARADVTAHSLMPLIAPSPLLPHRHCSSPPPSMPPSPGFVGAPLPPVQR